MKPLFVAPQIVKTAQPEGGELPRDVSQWPMRIRDEWLKVAPYAYMYPTEIIIDEMTDAQKGAAFGHILLTSKTGLSPGQAAGQMGTEIGIRTAKIPVIIEDFKLFPFDMIKTEEGKFLPLNESRLGEALFRPSTFDAPFRGDVNELFGNPIYPPDREKAASLDSWHSPFPILGMISDTIYSDQLDRLGQVLEKNAGLRQALVSNPITHGYLAQVSEITPCEPLAKTASETFGLTNLFNPDVMLVRKLEPEQGDPIFQVKTAMRRAYEDTPWVNLPPGPAVEKLGPAIVKEADVKGMVIIIRRPRDAESPIEMGSDRPSLLGGTGPCHAFGGGRGMGGWLMTKVMDALTGGRSPMRLFSDGDSYGYQDDIGALPSESAPPLKTSEMPEGLGSFCWEDEQGEVACTEPIRCKMVTETDGRKAYECETIDGRQVKLVTSPAVRTVSPGTTGTTLLPESAKWVSLGDKMVKLDTSAQVGSLAEKSASVCTISHSGGAFNIQGGPLLKIGERIGVGPADAMFTLGLLGFSKEAAERTLARAYHRGQVKVARVSEVTLLSELRTQAETKTASFAAQVDTFVDTLHGAAFGLIKDAASLGDAGAVDAILSLGFLNIDNLSRFVAFIPAFEAVQHRLGTLLLAARLGLSELPQEHVSRAFFALEHVLAGLKRVSARLSTPAQA